MIKPEVLDAMVAAGCTAQQIAAAVKADQSTCSGAARQARYRARKASLGDERFVTAVTVTDTPSPKEISPTPPKEITPTHSEAKASSKITPRSELETVLDSDRAGAVLDHRQRIRKPLTAHAAKLLAGKFARCPDPNAAADAMIGNGWQGFEPEWLDRPTARGSPPPLRGLEAVAARVERDIERLTNGPRNGGTAGADPENDAGFPLLAGPRH